MKKSIYIILAAIFLFSGNLLAQNKVWVPVFRFALDGNVADNYYLMPNAIGSFASDHRFADGTQMLGYHFKLSDFENENNQHPLTLRVFLENEYIVEISDQEITDVSEGEIVAKYSDDPDNNPCRDAHNRGWIDIPLQDYFDLGWTDLYLYFFDGRPQDGWGPSVYYIGFYYQEDPANIPDNGVTTVIQDDGSISVDGDFSDWDSDTQWVHMEEGAGGILSTGTIDGTGDVSADVGVSADGENLYIGANVTDDNVIDDGDSITFYFGAYNIDTLTAYSAHTSIPDTNIDGYRKKTEPDFVFSIPVTDGATDVYESKIVKGVVDESEAVCVKTTSGYRIEAKIPFLSLYTAGVVSILYKPLETTFSPFAFKITDVDKGGVQTDTLADFVPNNSAPETNYLVPGYTGSGSDANHRWADATDVIAYKFDTNALTNGLPDSTDFTFSTRVGNEYVIKVSNSLDSAKTEVLRWSAKIDTTLFEFVPNGEAPETNYLVPGFHSSNDNSHRWADGTDTIAYRFSLADLKALLPPNGEPLISVHVGNEYVISVSEGVHTPTTEILRWSDTNAPVHDMSNAGWKEIPLQPYVDAGWDSVTIFFTDGIPNDGWGPSIQHVKYIARKPGTPVHDMSNVAWQSFSLNPFIEKGWKTIYVFFEDGIPTDGWGPSVEHVRVVGKYAAFGSSASLVTARKLDVDSNPSSWGLKTNYIDKRTKSSPSNIAKGILKEFIPNNQPPETNYLVPGYEGSGVDANHRWADASDTIAYKFDLSEIQALAPGQEVFIEFHVCNEYVVSISDAIDGDLEEVARWSSKGLPVHDCSNGRDIAISTKDAIENGFTNLYVFFTDGIPADGWGPSLSAIRFYYKGIYHTTPTAIAFRPNNTAPETDYLVPGYEGSGVDQNHRWADATTVIAYKFTRDQIENAIPSDAEPLFNVHIGNEYVIEVADSINGSRTEVMRWSKNDTPIHDASNTDWQNFSLKPYLDKGWKNIYVFFSDGIPTDGWGASIDSVYISYREILVYNELLRFTCNGTEPETDYLVSGYTGSGLDNTHRWADGTTEMAYHFSKSDLLSLSNGNDNIVLRFEVNNEYVISVAPEISGDRTEVFRWSKNNVPEHSGSNQTVLSLNLKPYFDQGWNDVYLIFEDGIKETGWGPSLFWISINSLGKLSSAVNDQIALPHVFALRQNYPNPFNPETTISYSIPKAGFVSVKIYNVIGQGVKTLVNRNQMPGNYVVRWNGRNEMGQPVASGVYFYRISFGKRQLIKKMLLLR